MPHDLRQRRHCADLKTVAFRLHAFELRDSAQVDDDAGTFDAVFEPVEAVEATGQDPGARAVSIEQLECCVDRRRLEQLEGGHDVTNHCHWTLSLRALSV